MEPGKAIPAGTYQILEGENVRTLTIKGGKVESITDPVPEPQLAEAKGEFGKLQAEHQATVVANQGVEKDVARLQEENSALSIEKGEIYQALEEERSKSSQLEQALEKKKDEIIRELLKEPKLKEILSKSGFGISKAGRNFEVDGKPYHFLPGIETFKLKSGELTVDQALEDPQCLAYLVEINAGIIKDGEF